MDADFIIDALRIRHPREAWIFATEVQSSTGYSVVHQGGPGGTRRVDAFALALWPSLGFRRVAYEIKVSRADWLGEIADPMKRVLAWHASNEFWFAMPHGVFSDGDWRRDMVGCGLLLVDADGSVKSVRKARRRPDYFPMPMGFTASLMRCVRDQRQGDEQGVESAKG